MKRFFMAFLLVAVGGLQADASDKFFSLERNKKSCFMTLKTGRLQIPVLDLRCVAHKTVDVTADVAEGTVGVVGDVWHGTHSLVHEILFPCCRAHSFRSTGIYDLVHWEPCDRYRRK